ncbi:hypothetical protein [Paracoccus sp. T5]|uniref:hypothetical protein n=1 Tax=Paracoccus sp. T5 TaxID=3402161 RepID=UPI003ADC6D71
MNAQIVGNAALHTTLSGSSPLSQLGRTVERTVCDNLSVMLLLVIDRLELGDENTRICRSVLRRMNAGISPRLRSWAMWLEAKIPLEFEVTSGRCGAS